MVVWASARCPLPRGVQTKAQLWLAEIALASAAFGDMRHTRTMQVVKNLLWVQTPHAHERRDHGANLQTLALSDAAEASLQHCGTTGPGTICNYQRTVEHGGGGVAKLRDADSSNT